MQAVVSIGVVLLVLIWASRLESRVNKLQNEIERLKSKKEK